MININNFRIIQLDKYNLTFEEFKEVENVKTKEKSIKWVRVGGYYGNLPSALKGLKEYIVNQKIGDNENVDILKFIDELNNSYVNCEIKAKGDD